MSVVVPRLKFSVEQYHRMGESGILPPDCRVELLDGEIVPMTPIGSRHAGCVKRLNRLFSAAFADRAIVQIQDPVILGEFSEPEPDVVLLHNRSDFYSSRHPEAADVYLAVEVGDSSADLDRAVKLPLYAKAGIVELWLVNLVDDCIEVYREPKRGQYTSTTRLERGETVSCAAFPGDTWTIDEILGEPAASPPN